MRADGGGWAMRIAAVCFLAVLAGLCLVPRLCGAGPEAAPDLMELLSRAERDYASVRDYTATFHKQQRVGDVLQPEEKTFFKFRKPFMVYMKWIGDVHAGREALYVRGKYDNRLLVHLGGMVNYFAPAASLNPAGVLAMRNNLRPITESGMENTIKLIMEVCRKARENGDLTVRYCGVGDVEGRATHKFERLLPAGKGYPAHLTILELDRETGYPLSVVSYGWEGELLEKYRYAKLRLNTGLGDKDFDRGNREYGFGYLTAYIP